jgi:histidinol-phosphate/aromatic aminotransferase/cobyric acid decarboxylase-like protein
VPISASEVIVHRHLRAAFGKEDYLTSDKEDMRKSIHDTITKLSELASLRLGFDDGLFARAFGQAVGNNFSCNTASLYGMYDIVFEIFNEEFVTVDDDRFWKLTSESAQKAVKAAYDRIRHLSEHPEEYEKEKARVEKKWGVWVKPA